MKLVGGRVSVFDQLKQFVRCCNRKAFVVDMLIELYQFHVAMSGADARDERRAGDWIVKGLASTVDG